MILFAFMAKREVKAFLIFFYKKFTPRITALLSGTACGGDGGVD